MNDANSNLSEAAKRLRAALAGVTLTPEQTADDVAEPEDEQRVKELEANRPPHHG